MFHVIVAIVSVLICWKWGDWKNWKQYYPTILYFITGDLIYNFITSNKPLWLYHSPLLKHTLSNLLIASVSFPCTVMMFIPFIPRGRFRQGVYILIWALTYLAVEKLSYLLGYFGHYNGWNIYWSFLFDCILFCMLWLHYKRPLLAWPVAIVVLIIFLCIFNIPLSIMR